MTALRLVTQTTAVILLSLVILVAIPPAVAQEGLCDTESNSAPNRTARFEEPPPRFAFEQQNLTLPPLVVEQTGGDRAPTDVSVIARNASPITVFETGTAEFQNGDQDRVQLVLKDANLFNGSSERELGVCLDGVLAASKAGPQLDTNWTIHLLEQFNLKNVSVSSLDKNETFDPPAEHLTTASHARISVERTVPEGAQSHYNETEQQGALELVVGIRPTPSCGGDGIGNALATVPSDRELGAGGAGGWSEDGTEIEAVVPLDQVPACRFELSVSIRLGGGHCMWDTGQHCKVSDLTIVPVQVLEPSKFPSPDTDSGFSLPTVWATEDAGLDELQDTIDNWVAIRPQTKDTYDSVFDGTGEVDLQEVSTAQTQYNESVKAVRATFADLDDEGLPLAVHYEDLRSRWNQIVREDERSFDRQVDSHVASIEDGTSEHWGTVRKNFLIGFGAAFVPAAGAFAALTVRWHRKKEYWSMFSSKASFTHPTQVAGIVAALAILAGLVWGLVEGSFDFSRLVGLSIGPMEGSAWI